MRLRAAVLGRVDGTLTGVTGGGGRTPGFLLALMRLQAQGRFPLEKLVRRAEFADINQAADDSDAGTVVEPIPHMGRGPAGAGGRGPVSSRGPTCRRRLSASAAARC